MSEAAKLNLGVQRNEDYVPHTYILQDVNGDPIDLSGWSFRFEVSGGFGIAPSLVLTGVPNANGSYIKLLSPGTDGSFELFIAEEDMAALGGPVDVVAFFVHNLIGIDSTGRRRIIARGSFYAEPGV